MRADAIRWLMHADRHSLTECNQFLWFASSTSAMKHL